jgi:hypothetical protein
MAARFDIRFQMFGEFLRDQVEVRGDDEFVAIKRCIGTDDIDCVC